MYIDYDQCAQLWRKNNKNVPLFVSMEMVAILDFGVLAKKNYEGMFYIVQTAVSSPLDRSTHALVLHISVTFYFFSRAFFTAHIPAPFINPGAKAIKKNTNSTQNKSETRRASKQYEVTSFLSTDCELSTETCSKNVYSLGHGRVLLT